MKKLFLFFLLFVLTLGLVACGETIVPPDDEPDDDPDDEEPYVPPIENRIQLSYADWGDRELNQALIDAFEEAYPNIDVELRTDIAGSGAEFTGNLELAATIDLLPDVFATDNVPTVVSKGLTLDVSQFWDADDDAKLVYEYIANTAIYNGKRYAIPSFQFLKGILINLDIFEKANLVTKPGPDGYRIDEWGYPVKDWTFQEFVNIAKAIKNVSPDAADAVVGLDTWYGSPDFQQVWPTMYDANVMYDTFDGEKFNYTSENWIYAMQEKVKLHQLTDWTTTRFTPSDLETYSFLNGYLIQTGIGAMDIEGSWQFWVIQDARNNGINLGFWPYPQGPEGLFPPTVLDYQAVSYKTAHPQEAYELAKWMTYGKAGWLARLDIMEERNAATIAEGNTPAFLDRFPIADYPEVWERVYPFVEGIEGIEYIFEHIDKAKPDLDKWLPGYKDFWAWVNDPENNNYSWDALVTQGPTAVEAFAAQWNAKANQLYQDALQSLGNPTPPTT